MSIFILYIYKLPFPNGNFMSSWCNDTIKMLPQLETDMEKEVIKAVRERTWGNSGNKNNSNKNRSQKGNCGKR